MRFRSSRAGLSSRVGRVGRVGPMGCGNCCPVWLSVWSVEKLPVGSIGSILAPSPSSGVPRIHGPAAPPAYYYEPSQPSQPFESSPCLELVPKMSVVGIDFGYDNCYISVARAGGIETIANDYSMRDTPSMVGFTDRQRTMGVGAKNQLLTNLKRTFFGFKALLGRSFEDPLVQTERARLPFPISMAKDGGILVHVDYLSQEQAFTPQQLTAMLFTKIKDTADQALQTKVKDVVISVPIFYTDRERRSLLDAATIAGLNVLKLMNDTTATALAYGIYKQDLPAPEEKPRNVIFVDSGHRGIQVAAGSFHKGKLVIQACAFDRNCGGQAFNEALAKFFAEEFRTKYKIDALSNKKALLKLTAEGEKLKKQMSANTNKLPLNIECFMEDKDVSASVDRAKFEELISPQLKRIEEVMRECLAAIKWKTEDIYSVEIVGGSTRIPAIKNLIEDIFGKAPNTTLNADEAVSRGCALQCAILSPTFKVREFSVTDLQPYPIKLKWQSEGDSGDMEVFPKFHAVPYSKMLTFYRRDNFVVEGEYDGSAPLPDQHIGKFEIGEVKPLPDGSNQKVKVKVRVNLHGIFVVSTASYSEKHEIEEEVPMEVETPKEGANSDAANTAGDKGDKGDKGQEKKTEGQESGERGEPMEETSKEDSAAKSKEPVKMEKRKKTVTKTIELPITPIVAGALSRDKLELATDLEKTFVAQDTQEGERLNAKNTVEEYIYDIRSKIHDELADFIAEEDRAQFVNDLEAAENWLYEDGEDCEKTAYVERLKALRLKGEPVRKRKEEFELRPQAIDLMGRSLQQASKVLDLYNQGDEKFSHIDPAEMDKVVKLVAEKRAWLDENCATLANLPKTVNPPILAVQFHNERQAFENVAMPILNKPKPKVEPPPQEKEKTGGSKKKNENGTSAPAAEDQQPAASAEHGKKPVEDSMDVD
ncbi:hypothetical protein TCAL_10670 [Tigriopus californicus]|uniref:Uncharacterized protein n=2 Tax=Tigriopus californicus TaxID=6832 RepID=A0A553P0H6_TIGCA|nr:hypothetical protein TCAL_10670 [Tigriopus californicus]